MNLHDASITYRIDVLVIRQLKKLIDFDIALKLQAVDTTINTACICTYDDTLVYVSGCMQVKFRMKQTQAFGGHLWRG